MRKIDRRYSSEVLMAQWGARLARHLNNGGVLQGRQLEVHYTSEQDAIRAYWGDLAALDSYEPPVGVGNWIFPDDSRWE